MPCNSSHYCLSISYIFRSLCKFMNIEPLYQSENPTSAPSRSTVFLQSLISFLWWAGWIFLAIFTLIFLGSALGALGMDAFSSRFTTITPVAGMALALSTIVGTIAFLVILKQLRLICQTLVSGDPFVPENAQRLRVIWIAVAIAEILRLVSATGLATLHANGQNIVDAPDQTLTMDLRLYVWFSVLVLIVLSEVFREGARLRQEQKLTV
ncbi:MAG: hypothetical protein COA43_07550 [Robiginitomaculum sp.]|nr:MAG: hypothetical protein COA43_07550 [Robiginitomaculum sp.]